jgi:hypothetical protein
MKVTRLILLSMVFSVFSILPSYSQLKVVASGNVGIGTSTPAQKLDIAGNLQTRGSYHLLGTEAGTDEAGVLVGWERTAAGIATIRFYNNFSGYDSWATTFGVDPFGAGGLFHKGAGALGIVTQNTSSVQFGVQNNEKMRINGADGFVGINTATPGFQLEVNGNAGKPGGGVWSTPSDRRLKKDVKPFKDGLQQVLAINPVTFRYNGTGGLKADGKEYVGVIAQEMQQVAPYTINSFTHKKLQTESKDGSFLPTETVVGEETFLSYDGTAVTYMLVNAIKEQQRLIDEKDARINSLEERLSKLEKLVSGISANPDRPFSSQNVDLGNSSGSILMQNEPNPFNQTTRISYNLPTGIQSAYLRIQDINGRLLKNVKLSDATTGEVKLTAGELAPGTYTYSLIIEGKVVDTKKMVLTR